MLRLMLTRHGETVENTKGIIQGHLHGRLSEKGRKQAMMVAERLKSERIDFIYSSDLARSADTAREIAKFHPDARLKFVAELRERDIGEFQGKAKKDFGWGKEKSLVYLQPKNGETLNQMLQRADKFIHELLKKHDKEIILLVGHNGINKAIMCAIQGRPSEDILELENFGNTSITVLDVDEDMSHRIRVHDCTRHLAGQ